MHKANIESVGSGEIGGKGNGFKNVIDNYENFPEHSDNFKEIISFPKTLFLTTSLFDGFVACNQIEDLIKKVEQSDYSGDDCIRLSSAFMNGSFQDELGRAVQQILDTFESPVIIRSSSILEDQKGTAFAGKYESVFVGNQGSADERKKMLSEAIKKVYSTTYNMNVLAYRKKRGLIDEKEKMALLVQEVVGRRYGNYYLPAMAGVGFSQNGYCWNREIKKSDGLVRLVFGLGTRAVGRGYVRLFSPCKPSARPEGTEINNIQKCSQKKIDVVDMESNVLREIHFRELIKDGFNCFPGSQQMISLRDGGYLYRPVSNMWDPNHVPVLTMDGVLSSQWMNIDIPKILHWLLQCLEVKLGYPIDLEFAINARSGMETASIYVLQVRPLSEREGQNAHPIPELNDENIIFAVNGSIPTSFVPDIEYLVYVDDLVYQEWPHKEKQSVARVIGKINETLKGKRFALIGPGRWGSWNPELGVPVNYSEISNTVMLIEVARRKATYTPEVSFGSHFFQDLIEDRIGYLPVYPDEHGTIFNESINRKKSDFNKIMSDEYFRQFDRLIKIIHVPTVFKGKHAHAIMNGEAERAVFYIK